MLAAALLSTAIWRSALLPVNKNNYYSTVIEQEIIFLTMVLIYGLHREDQGI
jgi:hypothetical protein